MKIENLYVPDLYTAHPDERLADAAARMRGAEISALPVVDDLGELLGIISERDMTRAVADRADPETVRAGEYAADGVVLATPDEDVVEVADRMLRLGIRHLPVIVDGHVAGMVSMRDILAVQAWT